MIRFDVRSKIGAAPLFAKFYGPETKATVPHCSILMPVRQRAPK